MGTLRSLARTAAVPALRTVLPPPPVVQVPPGRRVDLPGRGSPFVVDLHGPDDRPPLLLLHALGCTAYLTWFPSMGPLSERSRVVAFDQRWHGRGIRSEHFRLADCADDAVAVADALGIDRFVVVGYSMGGAIAQLVWRRHRDRVAGLVLAATARNFRGRRHEKAWFTVMRMAMQRYAGRARAGVERCAARLAELPDLPEAREPAMSAWALAEFRSTSTWGLAAALQEVGDFDSSAWVGQVDVPTSVVVTARDRLVPTRRQVRLAESIPGAVTHWVPGAHAAVVLAHAQFVPVLVEACDSVALRARRLAQ